MDDLTFKLEQLQGRIHGIMNNLHVMKSNEYDGANTANLVGIDLMASLGNWGEIPSFCL